MPVDNLEIFKKVIFHLPPLEKTISMLVGLGLVYSGILYLFVGSLLLESISTLSIPVFALMLFILPGAVAAELYHLFLPQYPRKWGYFLSLANQMVIFMFSVLLTFSDTFPIAWKIIWLGLVTLYVNNFLVLLLSVGPEHLRKISLLSLIQPAFILSGFHIALGRFLQISALSYATNFLMVLGAGIVLLLAIQVTDFLVGSNVSNISMFELAAALLKKEQEKLDLGRPVKPDIQTFEIENATGVKRIAIPWLHPGPIEGFGGGQITSEIIQEINEEGEGFFLHVPSCHQMDPSDPRDSEKVISSLKETSKTGKASKMYEKEFNNCHLYGRAFGNQKIIFMDHKGFDDYDSSIFEDQIDKENVSIIDLHNQPKGSRLNEMRYGTEEAEEVRGYLREFIQDLEKLPQRDYHAGFHKGESLKHEMALVEKVGNQKTLLFGIEGNDSSKELLELREEFKKSFDEVLLFTTDTHASIHDLADEKQVEKSEINKVVDSAIENLSPAKLGLSNQNAKEMNFLKDDYYGLTYTINILVRLIPISLLIIYVALAIWLF